MWVRSATAGGLATSALLGVDYALSQLDVARFSRSTSLKLGSN